MNDTKQEGSVSRKREVGGENGGRREREVKALEANQQSRTQLCSRSLEVIMKLVTERLGGLNVVQQVACCETRGLSVEHAEARCNRKSLRAPFLAV